MRRTRKRKTACRVQPAYLRGVKAVAEYLGGCHETTVRRWMKSGQLPRVKIGNTVLVRLADLERFMESRRDDAGHERTVEE